MAVTKIWQVKDSLFRVLDYCNNPEKTKVSDLQQVIRYAADEEKTDNADEQFHAVTGINCKADTAFEEMRDVQERYGKTGGNIAYHAYQSFKTGEVTAEQCHRLGVELAQKMWGDNYQVLVATHFNTGTFHNHFIVNAVGMWDGKKYDCSMREYYRMRRLSDEMCAREGLTVIEHPGKRASRTMYNAEKKGEPTKFNLMREAIDYALSMSWDKETFTTMMRAQGYVFSFNPNRNYATIRSVNSSKATRVYRLGEEYDRPAVLQRLAENREYDLRQVQSRYNDFNEPYFSYDWVQLHPPKRDYFYRTNFYYTDLRYGSLPEIVIVVIVLIALILCSIFGIFYSGEDAGTGMTMRTAVSDINNEFNQKIDDIKSSNTYDVLDMSGAKAEWKEVLAVYAVKMNMDLDNPQEVMTMDESKKQKLRDIFWDMNEISHNITTKTTKSSSGSGTSATETTTTTKTLHITVTHKTADDMALQYHFSREQIDSMHELLDAKYNSLWSSVLHGIISSNSDIVAVAQEQIGNVGGQPYWSWYGFSSRVEWCCCFVSWCANECGYIDAGVIPKYSVVDDGVNWFKSKGQWIDGSAEPLPGMIIFFDWEYDGLDGSGDHTGIVEKVEGGRVYTIEGNASDNAHVR